MRFLLLLLLAGCGSQMSTSPRFKPYIERFNNITGRNVSTPIYWGDSRTLKEQIVGASKTDALAVCHARQFQGKWHDKHITADRKRWKYMQDKPCMEFIVVVHELVHCDLQVSKHDPSPYYFLEDGTITWNIMYEAINVNIQCEDWNEELDQQVRERWSK